MSPPAWSLLGSRCHTSQKVLGQLVPHCTCAGNSLPYCVGTSSGNELKEPASTLMTSDEKMVVCQILRKRDPLNPKMCWFKPNMTLTNTNSGLNQRLPVHSYINWFEIHAQPWPLLPPGSCLQQIPSHIYIPDLSSKWSNHKSEHPSSLYYFCTLQTFKT